MDILSILIIEDNSKKLADIKDVLLKSGIAQLDIAEADCFASAIMVVKDKHFDIVLMDIRIPNIAGGEPDSKYSRDLSKLLSEGILHEPSYIIGLTQHAEEIENASKYPIEYMTIEKYCAIDRGWEKRIIRYIAYICKSKSTALQFYNNSYNIDILIVIARHDNEFVPIINSMNWEEGSKHEIHYFPTKKCVVGSWVTENGYSFRTAVVCAQTTGMATAASVCSNAINYFRPKFLSMLGMCCGTGKIDGSNGRKVGDVVIMLDTVCWDEGRYFEKRKYNSEDAFGDEGSVEEIDADLDFFEAEFLPEVSRKAATPNMRLIVDKFTETEISSTRSKLSKLCQKNELVRDILEGKKELPTEQNIWWGENVSGSSVVQSRVQLDEILKNFPECMSLEMECHAIYNAVGLVSGKPPEAICIKGVADYGDNRKTKEYQKLASVSSLLVFEMIMETYRTAEISGEI